LGRKQGAGPRREGRGEEDGGLRGFLGQAGPAEINGPEESRGERGVGKVFSFLKKPFQTHISNFGN
jgi:hypothetical protein